MSIPELTKRVLLKYRSDGLVPLCRAAPRYLYRAACRKAAADRFRGRRRFELQTALRHRVHRLRYDAPADPHRPLLVDPDEIERRSGAFWKAFGLGQIHGGDWDRPDRLFPVEEEWLYRGLQQRFEEGRDWEDTVSCETARRRFDEQGSIWGYKSFDQFRQVRCPYVDDLFESIRRDGFRSNVATSNDLPASDGRTEQYVQRLDPLVAVARDGEILLHDGRHRVAIARILDLESIPVNVLGRHSLWQRRRDDVAEAGALSELPPGLRDRVDHPDLADVVPGR